MKLWLHRCIFCKYGLVGRRKIILRDQEVEIDVF